MLGETEQVQQWIMGKKHKSKMVNVFFVTLENQFIPLFEP